MIHIRLDGIQINTSAQLSVIIPAYNHNTISPNLASPFEVAAIPAAGTQLINPTTNEGDYIEFRNISTAGQIIWLDTNATVSDTSFRMILYPGETEEVVNTDLAFWGVSSAAANSLVIRPFRRGP
jgi:hypothetical protein